MPVVTPASPTTNAEHCPHCLGEVPPFAQKCHHCGKGLSGKALLAPEARAKGSGASFVALVFGGIAAGFGVLLASQATIGTALVGVACFLGIVGRVIQAGEHHRELMNDKDK